MRRQLGKAFTVLALHEVKEHIAHADVAAFGAPGECHGLISRGEERRYNDAKRIAKTVSGMTQKEFNAALRFLPQRAWNRLLETLHAKHDPFYL